MASKFDRREVLKLTSLLPLLYLQSCSKSKWRTDRVLPNPHSQNVFIIVFDAFSALDIPFYGYPRNTTPNLSSLLNKATVYHNHYAGSNWTTPGTASLLAGTLPWTHRAFPIRSLVSKPLTNHNIFNAFDDFGYNRFAYTHNILADALLSQFGNDLENHIPFYELLLEMDKDWASRLFNNDYDIASVSKAQILENNSKEISPPNSLFLPDLYKSIEDKQYERILEQYGDSFPRGIPKVSNYFILEDGIDFLLEQLGQIPQPFLGYFHFLPPHKPFWPRREFTELFIKDGFKPQKKPEHLFSMRISYEESLSVRKNYDQNIAYVDAEFARLFTFMENSGLLENTWLVFTSDHGELFERGIIGHNIENLHEPAVKVPLIIFEPGQTTRRDIYTPTSCIDILPTLLQVTGQPIPEWAEGEILPPYRESELNSDRSIYSMQPRYNSVSKPLTRASVMMVKGQYKFHSYFGYDKLPQNEPLYELYDLENDPEELDNIYSNKRSLARDLQNELQEKLDEVNEPFL